MSTIFLFINAFLPIVLQVLQQYKAVSPETGALITGIEGAASVFSSLIKDSNTNSVTAASLLAAISSAVEILQAQTQLDPKALIITNAFIKAAQAGYTASVSVTTVDPAALKPYVAD